jgi:hypothetical protein
MKLWRIAGAMAILVVGLLVIVPLAVRAAHELLVPATVGVVLYLVVRVVNARVDRW